MADEIDIVLISQCKRGNTDAFEKLVTKYEKTVYNIAVRMLSDTEDARDVSQEVFIKVYNNIAKYEEIASFSTWIYRITYNACIDQIRKYKNKETISIDKDVYDGEQPFQLEDDSPTPEEKYLQKESARELESAIDGLSNEHRAMIVLRDIKGLSYSEICEITELSIGTVKSRIWRARNALKNIIKKRKEQNKLDSV